MKTLRLFLFSMALLGTIATAGAQRKVVKVYPKHGTIVTTVKKPTVIVHKKTNFYFAHGVWYKAKGKKYVVVSPPVGVLVRKLPRGNKVVVVNGRKLYKYKGVWYKKSGRHFTVVRV
ncbi:MAG: DUF6515 family protein [Flavobacteriaceae bacterium]